MAQLTLNKPSGGSVTLVPQDGVTHDTVTIGGGVIIHRTLVTTDSSQSVAANTWYDVPNLSVTFTPQSTTSKFRIDVRWLGETNNTWNMVFAIARNDTRINLPDAYGSNPLGLTVPALSYFATSNDTASTPETSCFFTYDEPATSEQLTYKVQFTKEVAETITHGRAYSINTGTGYERASLEMLVTEYV